MKWSDWDLDEDEIDELEMAMWQAKVSDSHPIFPICHNPIFPKYIIRRISVLQWGPYEDHEDPTGRELLAVGGCKGGAKWGAEGGPGGGGGGGGGRDTCRWTC